MPTQDLPKGTLTGGEREITPVVFPHIDVKATFPRDLLELSGRTGGTSKVIKAPNNLQHGRQRHSARIPSEAGVRTVTVMDIRLQRPVDANTVRRWEDFRIASGPNLGSCISMPPRER